MAKPTVAALEAHITSLEAHIALLEERLSTLEARLNKPTLADRVQHVASDFKARAAAAKKAALEGGVTVRV